MEGKKKSCTAYISNEIHISCADCSFLV